MHPEPAVGESQRANAGRIELLTGQISRGFQRLVFVRELEPEFRRYFQVLTLRRMRICLALALVLFASFDIAFSKRFPEIADVLLRADFSLTFPMLLLTFGVSFTAVGRPWLPLLGVLCILVLGMVRIALYGYTQAHGVEMPYEGLLLIVMGGFFLLGLTFYRALILATLFLVSFVVVMGSVQLSTPELVHRTYYLLATTLMCGLAAYTIEYATRYNFLYNQLQVHHAESDALTGMRNRRAFMDHYDRLWKLARREGKPIAVCIVDADCFKAYNDHYGHLEGEAVLRALAEAIGRIVRRPLDGAARYGGEEFVVVWYDLSAADARLLAERLIEEVRMLRLPHAYSDASSWVSVSAGVAMALPDDDSTPIQLLRRADEALYKAKQGGRDRFEMG